MAASITCTRRGRLQRGCHGPARLRRERQNPTRIRPADHRVRCHRCDQEPGILQRRGRRPRLGRHGRLGHHWRTRRLRSAPSSASRPRIRLPSRGAANLPTLSFFQMPLFPERRIMADDGLYIEELLRSWAADGAGFLTAAEARHYRDALMLWPSPHCALEYQRMFVRNHFRSMGRDFRRALRQPMSGTAAVDSRPRRSACSAVHDDRGREVGRRAPRPDQPAWGRPPAA